MCDYYLSIHNVVFPRENNREELKITVDYFHQLFISFVYQGREQKLVEHYS